MRVAVKDIIDMAGLPTGSTSLWLTVCQTSAGAGPPCAPAKW
jgi:hypothetical protein